jgi:hypothetical protein
MLTFCGLPSFPHLPHARTHARTPPPTHVHHPNSAVFSHSTKTTHHTRPPLGPLPRLQGYCYVNYSTPIAAQAAVEQLNGIEFPPGTNYRIKVMYAEMLGSGGAGAGSSSSSSTPGTLRRPPSRPNLGQLQLAAAGGPGGLGHHQHPMSSASSASPSHSNMMGRELGVVPEGHYRGMLPGPGGDGRPPSLAAAEAAAAAAAYEQLQQQQQQGQGGGQGVIGTQAMSQGEGRVTARVTGGTAGHTW